MSTHTPGPWFVEVTPVYAENGSEITDECKANACLIAAAPDLFLALIEALNCLRSFHGSIAWEEYWNHSPEMQRAREAIKKATGETP